LRGNEKEFERASTPTIEIKCNNPAITLNLRIPLSEFSMGQKYMKNKELNPFVGIFLTRG
jgi:hypothetical protein